MEMRRAFTILLLILVNLGVLTAQELETRKHLTGATATIAPGFQKGNSDMNIYVHGYTYFYPEPKVSINGEIYWYLGGQEQQTLMAENSTLLFGPNYHFAKDGPFDPYIGIMPALSLVSAIDYSGLHPVAGKMSVVPLMTFNAGVRFHFVKWFNAFASVRYLKGTLVENYPGALSLDEFRISFGLGFNLYGKDFWKKKP